MTMTGTGSLRCSRPWMWPAGSRSATATAGTDTRNSCGFSTTSMRIYQEFDVHLVVDNYGTHKVAKVRACLARHPRYQVHFTPTSGSWLNLVERLFAELTERCVRRGSHTAVRSLEKSILEYLDHRNENPKPFVWTADADLILSKIERLSKRISRSGHECPES